MPFNIGMGEMILIFLVVLLLFGAKRLPEIGSSLGKGIREFKGSMREVEKSIKQDEIQQARYTPPPRDAAEAPPRRLTESSAPPAATAAEQPKAEVKSKSDTEAAD
jgi:sec-independent protein translocase protein TatA